MRYMICSLTVETLGFLFSTLYLPVPTSLTACPCPRNLSLPAGRGGLALGRRGSMRRSTARGSIATHPTHPIASDSVRRVRWPSAARRQRLWEKTPDVESKYVEGSIYRLLRGVAMRRCKGRNDRLRRWGWRRAKVAWRMTRLG